MKCVFYNSSFLSRILQPGKQLKNNHEMRLGPFKIILTNTRHFQTHNNVPKNTCSHNQCALLDLGGLWHAERCVNTMQGNLSVFQKGCCWPEDHLRRPQRYPDVHGHMIDMFQGSPPRIRRPLIHRAIEDIHGRGRSYLCTLLSRRSKGEPTSL